MSASRTLQRLARRRTGWPVGTVAWYGYDDQRACKVVAAVVDRDGEEPRDLAKWTSATLDLRQNPDTLAALVAHFHEHRVERIVFTDAIIGCPHEYQGQVCPDPACAFWIGRDRFAPLRSP